MNKKLVVILFILSFTLLTGCTGQKFNQDLILNNLTSSPYGEVLVCGNDGVIATTGDLKRWDYEIIGEHIDLNSAVFFEDRYIIAGYDSMNERDVLCNFYPKSRELIIIEPTDLFINSLEVADNNIFAFSSNTIKRSQDGSNWEDIHFPSESQTSLGTNVINYPKIIYYDGAKYIVSGGSYFIATSTDLKNWDFIIESQPSPRCSYAIASNGETNVMVGDHLYIAYEDKSNNTWITPHDEYTDIVINNIETIGDYYTMDINDIASDGERFVAVGSRGLVLSSDDGKEWTYSFVPNESHSTVLSKVIWNGKFFVALAKNDQEPGSSLIYTSLDGVDWN